MEGGEELVDDSRSRPPSSSARWRAVEARRVASGHRFEAVAQRIDALHREVAAAGDEDELRAIVAKGLADLTSNFDELSTADRALHVTARELSAALETGLAEKRASEAEFALLHAVVEHLPTGLLIVDPDEAPVLANARIKELVGIELELGKSLRRQPWPIAYRPDGRRYERAERPLTRALAGETVDAEALELEQPSGDRVLVEASAAPLRRPDGTLLGAVGSYHDIGERRRAEQAQREFVENAAHELLTPVAAIAGTVEALKLGAKDVPEERDRFLRHLERECERLGRLATALLTLARAQSGVEKPRIEIIELLPLLESLAAELKPARTVDVHVSCRPGLVAFANRELLCHALENLARNAAHFTRAGTIELRARKRASRIVVVEIADTGPGIRREDQTRLMRRFQRGPGRSDGFGLGLAIAHQAAEAGGGRLELESEEGAGTVARVRLDAAELVVQGARR